MSKRYGRNQKRAHRALIEALEYEAGALRRHNAYLTAKQGDSFNAGMSRVVNSKAVEMGLHRLEHYILAKYPDEELRRIAEQAIQSAGEPSVQFDATLPLDPRAVSFVELRAHVPAFHAAVRIEP